MVWFGGDGPPPSPFLGGLRDFPPPPGHLIKIFLLAGYFLRLEEPLVGPALLGRGKRRGMGGIGVELKGIWGAGGGTGGARGRLGVVEGELGGSPGEKLRVAGGIQGYLEGGLWVWQGVFRGTRKGIYGYQEELGLSGLK